MGRRLLSRDRQRGSVSESIHSKVRGKQRQRNSLKWWFVAVVWRGGPDRWLERPVRRKAVKGLCPHPLVCHFLQTNREPSVAYK